MVQPSSEYAQSRYDEVAPDYDRLWSRHMEGPQARLTEAMRPAPGERLADIACGTGGVTLDMARRTRPGDVVAVDYSENMLEAARERLAGEGIPVQVVHATGEQFVASAAPASFDLVSCRFALAYMDWRDMLPRLGRLLRPRGRAGLIFSTSASIPQAFQAYRVLRDSPRTIWQLAQHFRHDVGRAFRLLRRLRRTFGTPGFITVPEGPRPVAALLEQGGLVCREAWTETVRLRFPSGGRAVDWLEESGYATHPGLQHVEADGIRFLKRIFAGALENLRDAEGIPLDIAVAGVVAEQP